MGSLTFLELAQTVMEELGLTAPTTITSATDIQTLQIKALINRVGKSLLKMHDWTFLQTEYPLQMVAPTATTGTFTHLSAVITSIPSTTGIVGSGQVASNYAVVGSGLTSGARLVSVDSATQVTISEAYNGTTAAAQSITFCLDTYAVPDDFDRYIDRTFWDRTNHWELIGPQSPQFDQWQRSGIVTTGPRRRWRQIGKLPTVFRVWPPPQATDTPSTLVWEYISANWAATAGGTYMDSLVSDTDVNVFDDDIMILGTKWRFFQIKGFDYGALQAEWLDETRALMARDGGSPTLSLTARRYPTLLTSANVPDSGFGTST